MTQFQKRLITKWIVLFMVLLLFCGDPSLFPQKRRQESLEKLFQWSVMDYVEGRYREAVTNLEQLLSFVDDSEVDRLKLKAKVYLLLGAACEKMGRIGEARKNYRLYGEILEKQNWKEKIEIKDIDLSSLEEYRRMVKSREKAVREIKIIERPAVKRRKKRISPLLIIAGVAVVGILAALLLKKKNSAEEDSNLVPDYDTRLLGIQWVEVPAGEFMMGDNFNEGDDDELPVHAVYLNSYFISRYEVTFAQYDIYCGANDLPRPSDHGWGRGNRPVINVSWGEANLFCQWLSRKTGKNISFPTEAQWEKAARGTSQSRCPWGDSPPDCTIVNYNCDNLTHTVGSHPDGVSYCGVHDMAGNVAEWCMDVYAMYYYASSPYFDPVNSIVSAGMENVHRVVRGGSWNGIHQSEIRSADRFSAGYSEGFPTVGFRVVRVVESNN